MVEPTHTVTVNGLIVEIYDRIKVESEQDWHPNFWANKKIYIYDCLSDLTDEERDIVINYIYAEGFIDDRRTECDVIRGEDYF